MLNDYLNFLHERTLPNRWRPRVEIYVLKNNKILVGHHPEIGLSVPGGGIEKGQTLITAAKNECLEEAGIKIKNVKLVLKDPYYEDWQKIVDSGGTSTKKNMERMSRYRGLKIYYVKADYDGIDKSLLGADNDALKKRGFVSKQELIKAFQKQSKDFDPEQYAYRIKVIKLL